MDKIFIRDMVVKTLIGVDEVERRQEQEVVINIELFIDLEPASKSDDLTDTVDYRDIVAKIRRKASGMRYNLVETLAETAARICLKDKRVKKAVVSVEKVAAIEAVGRVGVEISRER